MSALHLTVRAHKWGRSAYSVTLLIYSPFPRFPFKRFACSLSFAPCHLRTYTMSSLKIEDLGAIQGDILLNGFPKKAQIFSFFTIRAAQAFCQNIQVVANSKIATGKDIKDLREQISKLAKGDIIDVAKTNIAFTNGGLTKVCGAVCIESDATNKA